MDHNSNRQESRVQNNRAAYAILSPPDEDGTEIGLIAIGLFEKKKNRWIKHYEDMNGNSPTYEQIDDWISNIPPEDFPELRTKALEWFVVASREYLADDMEAEKKKAVDDSILGHVKQATDGWKTLGIGVASSIIGSFVFGVLLLGFWWLAVRDPSPVSVARQAGAAPVTTPAPHATVE